MKNNVSTNAEHKPVWTVNIWPTIGISIIGGLAVVLVVALAIGWAITYYVRQMEPQGITVEA